LGKIKKFFPNLYDLKKYRKLIRLFIINYFLIKKTENGVNVQNGNKICNLMEIIKKKEFNYKYNKMEKFNLINENYIYTKINYKLSNDNYQIKSLNKKINFIGISNVESNKIINHVFYTNIFCGIENKENYKKNTNNFNNENLFSKINFLVSDLKSLSCLGNKFCIKCGIPFEFRNFFYLKYLDINNFFNLLHIKSSQIFICLLHLWERIWEYLFTIIGDQNETKQKNIIKIFEKIKIKNKKFNNIIKKEQDYPY